MTDTKRERIAKSLLETFRSVWCDRESDSEPYFNCSVCEFEDGENCVLKQFIKNDKYETAYPQGAIKGGDSETPQTDCGNCAHWEHGAGQHYYCALLEMGQECCFESRDESTLMFPNKPQTDYDNADSR